MRPSLRLLFPLFAAAAALAQGPDEKPMILSSPAFADGAEIPAKYTRLEAETFSERKPAQPPSSGEAVSRPLTWANIPAGTQSLLLHVQDVDTPQQRYPVLGPTQLHWLV